MAVKSVMNFFEDIGQKVGEEFRREMIKNRKLKLIDKNYKELNMTYQFSTEGYFISLNMEIGTDSIKATIFVQGPKNPQGTTKELSYKSNVPLDKVATNINNYIASQTGQEEEVKEEDTEKDTEEAKVKASVGIKCLYKKSPKLAKKVAKALGYRIKVTK